MSREAKRALFYHAKPRSGNHGGEAWRVKQSFFGLPGYGRRVTRANELQYKFNAKLQDSFEEAKSHLEVNAIDKAKKTLAEGTSLLAERQKLILLADKSDFGWKTVDEYVKHELAVDEEDGKKIRRAEERAEKAVKSTVA